MRLTKDNVNQARINTRLHHRDYGDLSAPGAVMMKKWGRNGAPCREYAPLFIHLTVTGRCNARCKGCINTYVTLGQEGSRKGIFQESEALPRRDARAVINLAHLHPDDEVTVCLYGGEPLLVADKVAEIMGIIRDSDISSRIRYLLYTNGELLAVSIREHPEVMKQIWLYAVGIDGGPQQHNSIRRGTDLARIRGNLEELRAQCPGKVLMWSTLREEQSLLDCFEEFLSLQKRGLADHLFWHWVETDERFENFPGYAARYEDHLRKIMDSFLEFLRKGVILPIAHVNELILFLLEGKVRGSSACGVEVAKNYDLMGGKIHACADLPPELAIGDIGDDGELHIREHRLADLVRYQQVLECPTCGVVAYCGGRCPVQALTSTPERLVQYCELMRLHVAVIQDFMPRITALMEEQALAPQDLYDQSAMIAQFTDVAP
ncbi:MAG: radical SAM protein [Candidatus Eremiobacteraeota bacterium]|nr:radical SAM protein [Candidatus Eremiobacteraeota bacterium]